MFIMCFATKTGPTYILSNHARLNLGTDVNVRLTSCFDIFATITDYRHIIRECESFTTLKIYSS